MTQDYVPTFTPPIKVKRLRADVQMPKAAYRGDACVDLRFAPEDGKAVYLKPGQTLRLQTGLAMEIPVGWEGLIRSRSGLAAKQDVFVLNSPGTVDENYRGEVIVILHKAAWAAGITWTPNLKIEPGDRIAQISFQPVYGALLQEAAELAPSARGTAGLGSSGVK